jgi:hypothetical protein
VKESAPLAAGGRGRVMKELEIYQKSIFGGFAGLGIPDVLVFAIDANCTPYNEMRALISKQSDPALRGSAVIACPEPHIERWYLADPVSFRKVVGPISPLGSPKCEWGFHK